MVRLAPEASRAKSQTRSLWSEPFSINRTWCERASDPSRPFLLSDFRARRSRPRQSCGAGPCSGRLGYPRRKRSQPSGSIYVLAGGLIVDLDGERILPSLDAVELRRCPGQPIVALMDYDGPARARPRAGLTRILPPRPVRNTGSLSLPIELDDRITWRAMIHDRRLDLHEVRIEHGVNGYAVSEAVGVFAGVPRRSRVRVIPGMGRKPTPGKNIRDGRRADRPRRVVPIVDAVLHRAAQVLIAAYVDRQGRGGRRAVPGYAASAASR